MLAELLELWQCSRSGPEERSWSGAQQRAEELLVGVGEEGGHGGAQKARNDPKSKTNQLGSINGMQGS